MSPPLASTLEEAIRYCGEGWLIDATLNPDSGIGHFRQLLGKVQNLADERLGQNALNLSEATLVAEYRRNPQKVRGFFQALGLSSTPEMLLMVWRILQGMDIKTVELQYARQDSFRLGVILESPYGEEDAPYSSDNISDFALFRHIGILEIGDQPVFDGFYALTVRGT